MERRSWLLSFARIAKLKPAARSPAVNAARCGHGAGDLRRQVGLAKLPENL
jgi:hypothetical protein